MSNRIYTIIISLLFIASLQANAQEGYPERARNYVKQYAAFAIEDQKQTGVPAAITLGQGILETEAGISELVTGANNHFGIKCKNNWQGETFLHTDDAKDECFKKYKNAQESYNDHSRHLLRNPRYSILFDYSITDYAKWAHGLKKCGYATNPKYAHQLIKIIEEYRLQQYTYAGLDSNFNTLTETELIARAEEKTGKKPEVIKEEKTIVTQTSYVPAAAETPAVAERETKMIVQTVVTETAPQAIADTAANTTGFEGITAIADSARSAIQHNEAFAARYPTEEPLSQDGKIITVNGLKAVVGRKGDVLLPYAISYKLRYAHLLEMNDLPDEPLAFDTYIYLEKKNIIGTTNDKHTVKEGETLLQAAQAEGIQLKKLAALNLLNVYEQPQPGAVLQLKIPATTRPAVIDYHLADTTARIGQDLLAANPIAASAKETERVGYGMSFESPKEIATVPTHKSITTQAVPKPVPQAQKQVDTLMAKKSQEIAKQPFMKEDPQQPQLKKPATEIEYKKGDKYYHVKKGETAFSIAKKHGITVSQLLKMNDLDPQDLKAGQTIKVAE